MKPLLVNIYVPLCCEECTFCRKLRIPSTIRNATRYADALKAEIASVAPDLDAYEVQAVRFTGGIPLLMGGLAVKDVLFELRRRMHVANDAEVTVQTVTGKVDEHNLRLFPVAHVTRLEFCVPTFVHAEHDALKCPGNHGQFSENDAMRRYLGPEDWALALTYGLPGQTPESWGKTLEKALSYEPPHVSLAVCAPLGEGGAPAADQPDAAALRTQAAACLRERGYEEYVLDAFARPGARSRYTELEADGADVVGLGLGAATLCDGLSYRNTTAPERYLAHAADAEQVVRDVRAVDAAAAAVLAASRGLGRAAGLDLAQEPGLPRQLSGLLDQLCDRGGVERLATGAYRLTDQGAACRAEVFAAVASCLGEPA